MNLKFDPNLFLQLQGYENADYILFGMRNMHLGHETADAVVDGRIYSFFGDVNSLGFQKAKRVIAAADAGSFILPVFGYRGRFKPNEHIRKFQQTNANIRYFAQRTNSNIWLLHSNVGREIESMRFEPQLIQPQHLARVTEESMELRNIIEETYRT